MRFSLKERRLQPEIMDDPNLDAGRHVEALTALARINWISASASMFWKPLWNLAQNHKGRTLRVLDVATGGGDIPIRLWHRAARASLKLEIQGGDISPTAVNVAREKALRTGAEVKFIQLDVLKDGIPSGFDVSMCSLFLHHLTEEDAVSFLSQSRQAAERMVLIDDLLRCRMGYLLAWLGCRTLTRSPVARIDGPRSVEGAFTISEIRDMAIKSSMENAIIQRHWPCRYLLQWSRP